MLLIFLLLIPLIGIFMISIVSYGPKEESNSLSSIKQIKVIALSASILNLFVSLIVFMLFNFSSNQFQFVQEYHKLSSFYFYLLLD